MPCRGLNKALSGDKDGALSEFARLLRTPEGVQVKADRYDTGWIPLRADPRFQALLNNPKNNEPLF